MATLKQIQQQLVTKGYSLDIDGASGPKTTAAIKKFQSDNGLTADGVVGPKTLEKLFTVPAQPLPTTNIKPVYQDNATLKRIQLLHPKLRAEGFSIYQEIVRLLSGRSTVRFTFTIRTFAEQQALYEQGRTKPGQKVTNSPAGRSFHNYGMAIDIALLVDKDGNGTWDEIKWDTIGDYDGDKVSDWMEVVRVFKKYGWVWGADWDNDGITKAQGDKDESFVDAPHFQKTFGYTSKDLLELYRARKVDAQGYVII